MMTELYRELAREIQKDVSNETMKKILVLTKLKYLSGIEANKKDKDVKKYIKEVTKDVEYHFGIRGDL